MAEGFIFFAAVLLQGFLCARLLPHKYNYMEKGILAGANVVMPNLSPQDVRKKYELYDNKLCTGSEAAEYKRQLQEQMEAIGYTIVTDRGDYVPLPSREDKSRKKYPKYNKRSKEYGVIGT